MKLKLWHLFATILAALALSSNVTLADENKEKLKIKCDILSEEIRAIVGSEACKNAVTNLPSSISNAWPACQELRQCKRTCRGDKKECKNDCGDAVKSCKDQCSDLTGDAQKQCKNACKDAKKVCKFACKQEKSEGKNACVRQYKTPECVTARNAIWDSIPDTGACIVEIARACNANPEIQE